MLLYSWYTNSIKKEAAQSEIFLKKLQIIIYKVTMGIIAAAAATMTLKNYACKCIPSPCTRIIK
jgi:hypothetical protein